MLAVGQILFANSKSLAALSYSLFFLLLFKLSLPLAAILHFGPQFYGQGSAYVQSRNGSVDDLAVDLRPDAGVDESEHRRADL